MFRIILIYGEDPGHQSFASKRPSYNTYYEIYTLDLYQNDL